MGSYNDITASFLSNILNNSYSNNSVGTASGSNNSLSINSSSSQNALNTLMFQNMLQMMLSTISSGDGDNSSSGYGDLFSSVLANQGNTNSDYSNLLYSNNNYNLNRTLFNTTSNPSTLDNTYGSNAVSSELGSLSAKYESNGNPGSIANNAGDYGGKSYGAWQFSSRTGSLNSFLNWMKNNNEPYYEYLSSAKAKDGNSFGANFDSAWKYLSEKDRSGFLNLQKNYVKAAYYDSAVNRLKNEYGIDINSRSKALQSVLWSTVVQFGVGGTSKIFSHVNTSGSDADMINDIYNEKQKVDVYFRSSSPAIRNSVYHRALNEKADALAMLYSGDTERG